MNSIEKYAIWFTIRVVHEYFDYRSCPVVLAPSQETMNFFRRNGMIYKMMERNKWALLSLSMDFSSDAIDTLCFEMMPQDSVLYYVTGLLQEEENEIYALEENPTVGKWIQVRIPFDKVKEEINIKIRAKPKYWEFIIIPKHSNSSNSLKLRIEEKRGRIKFNDIEELQFPGKGKAFRTFTTEKIKAKEIHDYIIHLYETKNNGERLLCSNIPVPRPDEFSIIEPRDTVTTYFYI